MKKRLPNIVLVAIFVIGLSLILYPALSDYWNSFHQTVAIATYTEAVEQIDDNTYQEMREAAKQYNDRIPNDVSRWVLNDEEKAEYKQLLDVSGTGIMGYIQIPSLGCEFPIYHGVDESVLRIAIGHIEGSSLPIGGVGTHTVLSGHRGLPSAKLFSDLDEMAEGDVFFLQVMDETLTYEVDKISIVLPNDLEQLEIEDDESYCTLVTCTPYGINSHRLLVRGRQVETVDGGASIRVMADAIQIKPVIVAPIVAIPMLFLLLVFLLMQPKKNKK